VLGLLYSLCNFCNFLIAKSWKFTELYLNFWIAKFVDICYVFYDVVFNEKIYNTFSDSHDIHAILTYKVLYLLLGFFRTMFVSAVIMHIFLDNDLMTRWANFGRCNLHYLLHVSCCMFLSAVFYYADDIRNHFSTSL